MSNSAAKPTLHFVRYYGSARYADRAGLGDTWTKPDESLAIEHDTPFGQIWFQAFAIKSGE